MVSNVDTSGEKKSVEVPFKFSDIPGQPLDDNWVHALRADRFKMLLSWATEDTARRSESWTPLGEVDWSWSAQANVSDAKETDCAKRWAVGGPRLQGRRPGKR